MRILSLSIAIGLLSPVSLALAQERLPLLSPERVAWQPAMFNSAPMSPGSGTALPSPMPKSVPSDAGWSRRFLSPGADSTVYAMTVQGDSLVVAGEFDYLGIQHLQSIALFDGSGWRSLGSGFPGTVHAVTWWNGLLVAGGSFTKKGGAAGDYLAEWDGEQWQPLNVQVDAPVYALAVYNGALAVGGSFVMAGPDSLRGVGLWDGQAWSGLDMGVSGGAATVYAVLASVAGLYVGGSFNRAGPDSMNNIALWKDAVWHDLAGGVLNSGARPPCVYALAQFGNSIVVGGEFYWAGAASTGSQALWNGTSWSALGGDHGDRVRAFAVIGSDLFATGIFDAIGNLVSGANHIARWDGTQWFPVRGGLYNHESYGVWGGEIGYASTSYRGNIYAGGHFTLADSLASPFLARWDGAAWSSVVDGAGLAFDALCFLPHGDSLIVGGVFFSAGSIRTGYIGAWDGATWHTLGAGCSADVYALAEYHGDIIAGGAFVKADGRVVNGIARWDGSSWQQLGNGVTPGMDSWVVTLHVWHDTLLVGGYFTSVEGQPVRHLATWDGMHWGEFHGGTDEWVNALSEWSGKLVVGGGFTEIGGVPASLIATWDGAQWDNLAGGLTSYAGYWVPRVYCASVYQNELVVGGDFDTSDQFGDMRCLASWNGTRWRELGVNGLSSDYGLRPPAVIALLVDGPYLTAAGFITRFGQTSTNHIARWDGTTWLAMGSGVWFYYWEQGAVWALTRWNDSLYVGGDMVLAGGHKSDYWAQWDESDIAATAVRGGAPDVPPDAQSDATCLRVQRRAGCIAFTFTAPVGHAARLSLVDVRGRTVRVLADAPTTRRTGYARWEGREASGAPAAAGVYRGMLSVDGHIVAVTPVVWLR